MGRGPGGQLTATGLPVPPQADPRLPACLAAQRQYGRPAPPHGPQYRLPGEAALPSDGRGCRGGSVLDVHAGLLSPTQLRLMSAVRASIVEQRFPEFVRDFMRTMYGDPTLCPPWAVDALASVGITLA